eukprot:33560-Amphidinium_carterae.1
MALWYSYAWATAGSYREGICEQVQILLYWNLFLTIVQFAIVLPGSLDISKLLGHDATWSGLLLSSTFIFTSVGGVGGNYLWAWLDQASLNATVVSLTFVSAFLSCLAGVSVHGVLDLPFNDTILIVVRACLGPCCYCHSAAFYRVAVEILTPQAKVVVEVRRNLAAMAGSGLGPLLSWYLLGPVEGTSFERLGLAAPFYTTGAIFCCQAVCAFVVLRGTATTLKNWHHEQTPAEAQEATEWPSDASSFWFRKLIYVSGNLYGLERTIVIGALEAATAYILETIFHWKVSKIGLWIGIIYVFGALLGIGVSMLKEKVLMMKCASLLGVLASVCLTLFVRSNAVVVLAVDLVLFTACFLACGVAEGLALTAAIPDSHYSINNMFLFRYIIKFNFGRSFSPLLVRGTISHSTALYCLIQVPKPNKHAQNLDRAAIKPQMLIDQTGIF